MVQFCILGKSKCFFFFLSQHSKEPYYNVGGLSLTLGWEDPLEEGMATHSNIPAWRIPMDRGALQAIVLGISESDMPE